MNQEQPQPSQRHPNLTRRQQLAIECLVTIPTIAEAARNAGVSRATLYRWLKKPAFRTAYSQRQAEALIHVNNQTGDLLVKVFEDLAVQLRSPDPDVRLQADRMILQYHHAAYGSLQA